MIVPSITCVSWMVYVFVMLHLFCTHENVE